MKTYKVLVEWTMQGTMFLTAKNKKLALEMLESQQYDDILFEEDVSNYEAVGEFEEVKE